MLCDDHNHVTACTGDGRLRCCRHGATMGEQDASARRGGQPQCVRRRAGENHQSQKAAEGRVHQGREASPTCAPDRAVCGAGCRGRWPDLLPQCLCVRKFVLLCVCLLGFTPLVTRTSLPRSCAALPAMLAAGPTHGQGRPSRHVEGAPREWGVEEGPESACRIATSFRRMDGALQVTTQRRPDSSGTRAAHPPPSWKRKLVAPRMSI